MTELTKTRTWLRKATNEDKTQEDAEWFLAMQYAEMSSELTWKERAQELQCDIRTPPTYEMLEEQYFDSFEAEGWGEEATKIREFYGATK